MAESPSNITQEMEISMAEELAPESHGQRQEHLMIDGEDPLKSPFPLVSALVYVCWRCVCGWAVICMHVSVCMDVWLCVVASWCVYICISGLSDREFGGKGLM